ncbi:MAG: type IX secretion system sortase PorU [Bacteroidales bacterium]|nr:type IX secretion system sortase PorU [Bacteroidales bacterium]
MKKSAFLVTILFINNLLTAQNIVFSDSIFWQSNKTFVDNEKNISDILSFDGAYNRSLDELPVYHKRVPINNKAEIVSISLLKADYQVVNKTDYQQVRNVDKILEETEAHVWTSVFRKQNFISFELVPLRKNPTSGELERLVYFEYKVNYRIVPEVKSQSKYASNSAMSSGRWYKIKVSESGIYKLTYQQLIEMGFTNMNNIGVFGYGGMVPKTAGTVIADDLPERPVYIADQNSNSVFDSGDYILFYADGPHRVNFSASAAFTHDFHNYSEYAYYFVSDRGSLKQPVLASSVATFDKTVNTYDDYVFLEKDSLNLMSSGRTMYWREFDYYLTHDFSLNIPNVSTSDLAVVTINLAAKSSAASNFNIYINGVAQPLVTISSVSGSATDWYARVNNTKNFDVTPTSDNFNFSITYNKTASNSKAWLDNIIVKLRRKTIIDNGYLLFRDTESVEAGKNAKYVISGANSGTVIWDITDRFNSLKITGSLSGSELSFNYNASDLKDFLVFNPSTSFSSPVFQGSDDVGVVTNQNLHALQPADLIIITHPDFYNQALTVKSIHENYDDMNVVIVKPEEVYNEFSSGTPDVGAMRNFVKMLYDRASADNLPQNLLLFGDGSYDNLSDDPAVSNFILTYESEASLAPVSSYVSDDFYVFLDDGEGSISGAHDMDMGVGRIPVKSVTEANAFVNKLTEYYSPTSYGNWKNNILLVADDAEGGETIHQSQSNTLALQLEAAYPVFNLDKVFLDDYEQISTVQGHRYPDVNQAINDIINNGVLVVNWIGHGNEKGWGHESILTLSMIKTWKNAGKYPIFVTATCEFTPFDHHDLVSGGEEVLLNPDGGGIALFSTTRLAFSSSNASLSYKFYDNLFERDDEGEINTIGLSVAYAKNLQGSDTNKRVFTLLGDPAMRPSVPSYEAFTTKINNIDVAAFNDTVSAMELVNFEGVIKKPDGTIASDFNGFIYPVVYDKIMDYTTRGNDGYSPLNYRARKNIIFKGKASVVNGHFSFEFIVPVDIAYFYDEGKVSYYAHNNIDTEAHGYDESFIIGGTSDNPVSDNDGPIIELFMNDEQFVPGGITDENPILLANISDESGINTVGSGIGHDITIIIDENTAGAIVLNKFYEAEKDDYTSGKVNYPMSSLEMGPHTITLKAWDVLNNSSEAVTDFIVANSSELVIDHIFNYPNPFSTNTSFYFDHNQPFVNLDVLIQVFTVSGKHVKTIEADIMTTGYRSEPIVWDGKDEYGDKIGKGVYVYKVKVKSPTGAVVDKFEKLVILN